MYPPLNWNQQLSLHHNNLKKPISLGIAIWNRQILILTPPQPRTSLTPDYRLRETIKPPLNTLRELRDQIYSSSYTVGARTRASSPKMALPAPTLGGFAGPSLQPRQTRLLIVIVVARTRKRTSLKESAMALTFFFAAFGTELVLCI